MRVKLALLVVLVLAGLVPLTLVHSQECTYTVQSGDTLAKIATKYGLEVWELQEMNDDKYASIWNGVLQVGWVLRVPCLGDETPVPTPVPGAITATPKYTMNMRAGPTTSQKVVGKAAGGLPVTLEARNAASNWVLGTNSSGQRGWLAAWLVTINGTVGSLPVSTEIVGGSPVGATPTPGVAPTAAAPLTYTGRYSNFVAARVKEIYKKGLARGNYAGRFTKIGDSETDNPFFVTQYDLNDYNLAEYGYLSPMLSMFKGSFVHKSQGAKGGFVVDSLLDPLWANPQLCKSTESSIECEYRTWKPSIALILVRTYSNPEYQVKYEENVRKVIDLTLKYNIIPVLSTVPYLPPGGWQHDMNNIIRKLSAEYQIPLWDLYETTSILPSNGVDYSTAHLSIPPDGSAANLSQPNLSTYGTVRRNLEALEVLHYVVSIRK